MNTNDNRLKAHKLIDHIFQDLLPAHGMAQRPEQTSCSAVTFRFPGQKNTERFCR